MVLIAKWLQSRIHNHLYPNMAPSVLFSSVLNIQILSHVHKMNVSHKTCQFSEFTNCIYFFCILKTKQYEMQAFLIRKHFYYWNEDSYAVIHIYSSWKISWRIGKISAITLCKGSSMLIHKEEMMNDSTERGTERQCLWLMTQDGLSHIWKTG